MGASPGSSGTTDERSTRGRGRSRWRIGRAWPLSRPRAAQAQGRAGSRHRLIPVHKTLSPNRARPARRVPCPAALQAWLVAGSPDRCWTMIRFPALNRAVRIAVDGAGRIVGNSARSRSRRGHEVDIAFSRQPDRLVARAARLITQSADEARLPSDPESPRLSFPTSSGACAWRGRSSLLSFDRILGITSSCRKETPDGEAKQRRRWHERKG